MWIENEILRQSKYMGLYGLRIRGGVTMFEKIMWSLFALCNLIGALYWATKGNNIGLELINLGGLFVSLRELQDAN